MSQRKKGNLTKKTENWISLRIVDKNESPRTFILELLENEKFRDILKKHDSNNFANACERIFELLNIETSIIDVKINSDDFFISETRKLEFCLMHNENGELDSELGITRVHFVDDALAKDWRNSLLAIFHPDKNHGSQNSIKITEQINKTYKRMTGKA